VRLPGLLRCPEGFRPKDAARLYACSRRIPVAKHRA
jgi:hypothetical protein